MTDFCRLEAQVASSGWLAASGVGSGDRVAIYARNHPKLIPLFAARESGR